MKTKHKVHHKEAKKQLITQYSDSGSYSGTLRSEESCAVNK